MEQPHCKDKAIFKTSLLFGRGPLHCTVWSIFKDHPTIPFSAILVSRSSQLQQGRLDRVGWCIIVAGCGETLQQYKLQVLKNVGPSLTVIGSDMQSLKHVWWYHIWHVDKAILHLTFMGSYGFSTKPKILLHSKKKKSDYLYFYMKIRFCFFFKFYRNFSVRLLLLFFFYLSGQLFFSIQFGDRNYNKTYTLPLKVKWPYPNKKCWFIIYSVSLGPFRNKVGLI